MKKTEIIISLIFYVIKIFIWVIKIIVDLILKNIKNPIKAYLINKYVFSKFYSHYFIKKID